MCLFSRPAWEDDVVFANRSRKPRRRIVSETVIRERHSHSPRPAQYIQGPPPRASTPIIKPVTPPPPPSPKTRSVIVPPAPTPPTPPAPAPPSPARLELVSVEEETRSQARSSRVSVGKKSRAGSTREEVYIERERERVRMNPSPRPKQEEYDTYRYVEGVAPREERRRSRSITYETNPRLSGRVTERERERVVIEDEGRRREYYRRP